MGPVAVPLLPALEHGFGLAAMTVTLTLHSGTPGAAVPAAGGSTAVVTAAALACGSTAAVAAAAMVDGRQHGSGGNGRHSGNDGS